MTEIIRTEQAPESIGALALIYILTIFVLFFGGLVILGLLNGWSASWLSLWLGVIFFVLAVMVDIYRKSFLPDEMLRKTRMPKVVPRRELRE